MASDLVLALTSAASGLRAQASRLRLSSENLANANSTGQTPGADPYRRQIPLFQEALDRATGANTVRIRRPVADGSEFRLEYDPSHPAANEDGYVKLPNVSALIEMADVSEAQRAYEANLNVIEASRAMMSSVVGLLRL